MLDHGYKSKETWPIDLPGACVNELHVQRQVDARETIDAILSNEFVPHVCRYGVVGSERIAGPDWLILKGFLALTVRSLSQGFDRRPQKTGRGVAKDVVLRRGEVDIRVREGLVMVCCKDRNERTLPVIWRYRRQEPSSALQATKTGG